MTLPGYLKVFAGGKSVAGFLTRFADQVTLLVRSELGLRHRRGRGPRTAANPLPGAWKVPNGGKSAKTLTWSPMANGHSLPRPPFSWVADGHSAPRQRFLGWPMAIRSRDPRCPQWPFGSAAPVFLGGQWPFGSTTSSIRSRHGHRRPCSSKSRAPDPGTRETGGNQPSRTLGWRAR